MSSTSKSPMFSTGDKVRVTYPKALDYGKQLLIIKPLGKAAVVFAGQEFVSSCVYMVYVVGEGAVEADGMPIIYPVEYLEFEPPVLETYKVQDKCNWEEFDSLMALFGDSYANLSNVVIMGPKQSNEPN